MRDDIDVVVTPNGSVVGFRLITPAAHEWVEENVQSEPYQWLGGSLVVDWRFAASLRDGMEAAGLLVS